eukprot:209497_1
MDFTDLFSHAAVQSVNAFTQYVSDLEQQHPDQDIQSIIQNMHDSKGMNYLHCACVYDCFEIIPTLLNDYHIDVDAMDQSGYTPILYSISNLDEQCLEQLLKAKPQIDIQTKDSVIQTAGFPIYTCGGQTIFHLIAEKNEFKCLHPLFKYLLDAHSNKMIQILTTKDKNGCTVMDIAKMFNRSKILAAINTFIRAHCTDKAIISALDDRIPNEDIRKTMKREYEMKTRQRISEKAPKYVKINEHSDVFTTEQTNYAVFVLQEEKEQKELFGMIREIKIADQFEHDAFTRLAQKYDKKEGICGHISGCVAKYILQQQITHNTADDTKTNDLKFEFDDKMLQNIIYKDLCDDTIIKSVEESIQFTLDWRNKYIEKHKSEFGTEEMVKQYMDLPCANFEISDYVRYQVDDTLAKRIVFLRMNNLSCLKEAEYECKERIIAEDQSFGNETFIVEFFAPRKLMKCAEFGKECKLRNMNAECMVFILDLNGHYNIALPMRIKNERNVIMVDTYTANHVKNPTAMKCFELTFDCASNQNK